MWLIESRKTGELWKFKTPRQLTLFMWGRDYANYHLRTVGRAIRITNGEMKAVEEKLKRDEL